MGRKRKKNNEVERSSGLQWFVPMEVSQNVQAFPLKPRVKLTNRGYKSVAGVSLESDFLGYFLPQLYLFSYQTSRNCKSSMKNKNQKHKEQMNSWIKILHQKSLLLN